MNVWTYMRGHVLCRYTFTCVHVCGGQWSVLDVFLSCCLTLIDWSIDWFCVCVCTSYFLFKALSLNLDSTNSVRLLSNKLWGLPASAFPELASRAHTALPGASCWYGWSKLGCSSFQGSPLHTELSPSHRLYLLSGTLIKTTGDSLSCRLKIFHLSTKGV